MKYLFIYNPHAGTRRAPLGETLNSFVRSRGLDARVEPTTAPGHATELAREAAAADTAVIVAVGGDGTINEIGRSLVGTPAALGVIPRGSGNGLARHLGIPMGLRPALESLLHSEPRIADAGVANGHYFFCTMGIGFDAAVVNRFNSLSRRGLLAYVEAGIREFFAYRPQALDVAINGDPITRHLPQFVTIANASQFGNGAVIAPAARLDDGRLDLVVVRPVGLVNALPLAWRLFTRRLAGSGNVTMASGTHFSIHRDQPGFIHVDGELITTEARIDVRIVPAAIRFWTPQNAAGRAAFAQSAVNATA